MTTETKLTIKDIMLSHPLVQSGGEPNEFLQPTRTGSTFGLIVEVWGRYEMNDIRGPEFAHEMLDKAVKQEMSEHGDPHVRNFVADFVDPDYPAGMPMNDHNRGRCYTQFFWQITSITVVTNP